MRQLKFALLGAGCALALAATAANAAVVMSSTAGPDSGPRAGETKIIDFDPGIEAGVTFTGDSAVIPGSLANAAAPFGDTTNFLTVPLNSIPGTATMTFTTFLGGQDVTGFSFYWGSIDSYNTLELLNRSGGVIATVLGSAFPPADGGQQVASTNRRVAFDLTGADQQLGGLRFTSQQFAFESDTFSFSVVPEPATWGLMIMGFGGLGAMLRSNRRRQAPVAA